MQRRSFIKHTAAAAGLAQLSPLYFSNFHAKVGVMSPLFSLSGYNLGSISNLKNYTDFNLAKTDLMSGKIDILVSSPDYLSGNGALYSLFGSFPAPSASAEQKESWLVNNYSHLNDYYKQFGLVSEYAASFSPLYVRFSRFNDNELLNNKHYVPELKIAAKGLRATWLSYAGYDVQQGGMKDELTKQLVNLHDSRLHLADAFSPALYLRGVLFVKQHENNDGLELKSLIERIDKQDPEAHYFRKLSEFSIYRDDVTRSAVPFEVLYREDRAANVKAEAANIKNQIRSLARADIENQQKALDVLVKNFNFKYFDSIPVEVKKNLVGCAAATADAIVELDPKLAALVQSYKSISLNV